MSHLSETALDCCLSSHTPGESSVRNSIGLLFIITYTRWVICQKQHWTVVYHHIHQVGHLSETALDCCLSSHTPGESSVRNSIGLLCIITYIRWVICQKQHWTVVYHHIHQVGHLSDTAASSPGSHPKWLQTPTQNLLLSSLTLIIYC